MTQETQERLSADAPPPVPWLATLLGLDKWGPHLLTTPGVNRLKVAAAALVIVTTYEWIAWSVLFNVIVNGAPFALGWTTPLALAFGALFAAGVLLFEQGILTSDASVSQRVAYVARMVLIVLSAFATAVPLELLVFNEEISHRLKEEGLREEALFQLDGLSRTQPRTAEAILSDVDNDPVVQQLERTALRLREELADLSLQRDVANTKRNLLQDDLAEAKAKVGALEREVGALERAVAEDPPERASLEQQLGARRRELVRAARREELLRSAVASREEQGADRSGTVSEKNQEIAALEAQIEERRGQIRDALQAQRRAVIAERTRVTEWLEVLQQSTPGEAVAVPRRAEDEGGGRGRDRVFNPYRAGFVHRSLLLQHLLDGRPPRWPAVSLEKREGAAKLLGLEGGDDPEAEERRLEDAAHFQAMYWRAFVVALFLPLLSILTKLSLLGEELQAYYSARAQAAAGNREAARLLDALEKAELSYRRPGA